VALARAVILSRPQLSLARGVSLLFGSQGFASGFIGAVCIGDSLLSGFKQALKLATLCCLGSGGFLKALDASLVIACR